MKTIMEVFDEYLLIETKNLDDSIVFISERNYFLENKSFAEIRLMVLNKVKKDFESSNNQDSFIGQQHDAFGLFYVIDRHDSTTLTVDGRSYSTGRFEINFFVRLGREKLKNA